MPQTKQLWTQSVTFYTCAGLLSAFAVGGLLGVLGRWVGEPLPRDIRFSLVGILSLALLLGDLGWVNFHLAVPRRQTKQAWAQFFGFRIASALWGLHVGIGFATSIKYGGYWAIAGMIFASGSTTYGAMLMGSYWLGRAFPVWIAPWASGNGRISPSDFTSLLTQDAMFRSASVVAIGWTALVALMSIPVSKDALVWLLMKPVELGWLYSTYILTWALVLVPALLLRKVLRDLSWVGRRIRERHVSRMRGIHGPLPEFAAPVLGTAGIFTRADLYGRQAILMFVRPEDGATELDKGLRVSGRALFNKTSGNLYVVCSGAADGCRKLLPEFDIAERSSTPIPVILDEDGSVARMFRVGRTPVAYRLDDKAQVVGFGYQV